MRFGSVDTFFDFGDWGYRMGRPVANEGFLRALLHHGSWDAYHFFCPDTAQVRLFSERVAKLVPDEKLQRRIFVSPQAHLAAQMQTEDFDVFHQGDFTYFLPFLAALRNRPGQRRVPITGVTHSLDGSLMQLRFLQLVLAGLEPCDAIICTSVAAKKLVENKLAEVRFLLGKAVGVALPCPAQPSPRAERIPLGVDDELFADGSREEARRFFRMPLDHTIALSVGRLSLRTKTDWSPILELLGRMNAARELDKFLLVIAGGGSDDGVQLLQSLIETHGLKTKVVLFANFPAEAKARLYQAADFYVSLVDNYQETFGLSVIEAMASGLPVIASDFDGYRDAVEDGKNGLLVPTVGSTELPDFLASALGLLDANVTRLYLSQMVAVDLERLRSALLTMASKPELRKKLGQEGKRRAERYRWHAVIRQYEVLWQELGVIAREQGPTGAVALGNAALLAGDGIQAFRHFPSRQLQPDDHLELTEIGRGHLRPSSQAGPARYDDVATVMSRDLEHLLLDTLRSGVRCLDDLRRLGASSLGATGGDVDFHILWLIKHGALRLA